MIIRLMRRGTKKKPHNKIVVADGRKSLGGPFIEQLGYYDASKQPPLLKLDVARLEHWVKLGAQPSPTVRQLWKQAAKVVAK